MPDCPLRMHMLDDTQLVDAFEKACTERDTANLDEIAAIKREILYRLKEAEREWHNNHPEGMGR